MQFHSAHSPGQIRQKTSNSNTVGRGLLVVERLTSARLRAAPPLTLSGHSSQEIRTAVSCMIQALVLAPQTGVGCAMATVPEAWVDLAA